MLKSSKLQSWLLKKLLKIQKKKIKELDIIKTVIISKMQSVFVFLDITKVADF